MWTKIKNWFKQAFVYNEVAKVTAEDLELAKAISDKDIKKANEVINTAKARKPRKKKQ